MQIVANYYSKVQAMSNIGYNFFARYLFWLYANAWFNWDISYLKGWKLKLMNASCVMCPSQRGGRLSIYKRPPVADRDISL